MTFLLQFLFFRVFNIFELFLLVKKLFDNKEKITLKVIGLILLGSLLVELISITKYDYLEIIVTCICTFFIVSIIFKRGWFESIYTSILSFLLLIIIRAIFILPIYLSIKEIYNTFFYYGILSQIITVTIVLLIYFYIPIISIMNFIRDKYRLCSLIIINIGVSLLFFVFYWKINHTSLYINIVYISFILIIMFFMNLTLWINGIKNEKDRQQLKMYQQYLPVIDKLIIELRSKQHDFDNHIQSIKSMIYLSNNVQEWSKIERYIDDIRTASPLAKLIKLDNKILIGLLYNKIIVADKLGIKFDIEINNYLIDSKLQDYELIEIVGILLDNALEAEKDDNILDRHVKILIDKDDKFNIIRVENKYPYLDFANIFKRGYSTKTNDNNFSRGFGLSNVKQIVNKYNGKIEIKNEKIDGFNYVIFAIYI